MNKRIGLLTSFAICILALAACTNEKTVEQGGNIEQVSASPMASMTSDASATFENGVTTYSDTVSYLYSDDGKSGEDEVGFSLAVKDGVIVDAVVEVKATHPISKTRQLAFKNGIKQAVVGKKLDGLQVDKVGGASLTSDAFNKWVTELK